MVLLIWIYLFIFGLFSRIYEGVAAEISVDSHVIPADLVVVWINLDRDASRRTYTEKMLTNSGLHRHYRISAVDSKSSSFSKQIEQLEMPCKRNTHNDLAVTMSHLKAMHFALYNIPSISSRYALIIEDDVRFLFSINFTALIDSAPKNFGLLQLTTSNHEASNLLWRNFKRKVSVHHKSLEDYWHFANWRNSSRNGKTYLFWSMQAYLVQLPVIMSFIDDVVVNASNHHNNIRYKLVNSFFPAQCKRTRQRPCILSNCLFADSYIYAGCEPTYVSAIPLVTGTSIGLNSSTHQEQVRFHIEGFAAIDRIYHEIKLSRGSNCSNGGGGRRKLCERLQSIPFILNPLD